MSSLLTTRATPSFRFIGATTARINAGQLDHMIRPSDLGLNEEPGKLGTDYVYNFNRGWSAHISPQRKEGVVYLMDYDYLSFLYNNGPNTSEWIYDNLLVLKGKPLKTRIYVIPTMGLSASRTHMNMRSRNSIRFARRTSFGCVTNWREATRKSGRSRSFRRSNTTCWRRCIKRRRWRRSR